MASRRRPTSVRAVTVVSMKWGWRCSRRALSAPPKPAAPNTATLGVTHPPLQLLGQRGGDLLAAGGDLLIGERPIGRPEAQGQRQRHLALADARAVAVDVEDLGAGQ